MQSSRRTGARLLGIYSLVTMVSLEQAGVNWKAMAIRGRWATYNSRIPVAKSLRTWEGFNIQNLTGIVHLQLQQQRRDKVQDSVKALHL